MDFDSAKRELTCKTGIRIHRNVPLKEYVSFGIGGPSALFATVSDSNETSLLLKAVSEMEIPVFVLGGGTNVLVSDSGFAGLTIMISYHEMAFGEKRCSVKVGASVQVSRLCEYTVSNGYAGLEFAAGLPGTVGGAVAGNAGCFGSCFADRLLTASVVHGDGSKETVNSDWFNFEYRKSYVQEKRSIIVEVELSVEPGDADELLKTADSHIKLRKEKHPGRHMKTAGSYFKNLPPIEDGGRRRAAGELLDLAGAQNQRVGDAAVFEKHANIIINRGTATAKDVLKLEKILRELVFDSFGVELEREVRFIGKKPEGF